MSKNSSYLVGVLFLCCLAASVTATLTDAEETYLSDRFAYYSTQIKNTSAHNPYQENEYSTCSYYDVCEFDVDSVVWSVSVLHCWILIFDLHSPSKQQQVFESICLELMLSSIHTQNSVFYSLL
jgi:hypothetical protein